MIKPDIKQMFDGKFKSWKHLWENIVLMQANTIEIPMNDFKNIVSLFIECEVNEKDFNKRKPYCYNKQKNNNWCIHFIRRGKNEAYDICKNCIWCEIGYKNLEEIEERNKI